eukprot:9359-Eustigmatos_ZCMA.PRE.1
MQPHSPLHISLGERCISWASPGDIQAVSEMKLLSLRFQQLLLWPGKSHSPTHSTCLQSSMTDMSRGTAMQKVLKGSLKSSNVP